MEYIGGSDIEWGQVVEFVSVVVVEEDCFISYEIASIGSYWYLAEIGKEYHEGYWFVDKCKEEIK